MEKWRHGHGDMETSNGKGKQKTEALVIFLNPFTFCSLMKKQTEGFHLQTDLMERKDLHVYEYKKQK
jgi:hypothetical protein